MSTPSCDFASAHLDVYANYEAHFVREGATGDISQTVAVHDYSLFPTHAWWKSIDAFSALQYNACCFK